MVGDTVHDVGAGKAAGLRTFAVTWGTHDERTLRAACPDVVGDDLGPAAASWNVRRRAAVASRHDPSTVNGRQYVIEALAEDSWRMFRILGEFAQGFEEMADVDKAVTIFGSARLAPTSQYYVQASGSRASSRGRGT
jgi:hypothetical protein